MKTLTATEAADALGLDVSRILQLCRAGRLGFTIPKHGRAWVITEGELDQFRAIGPKKPGPKKKPKVLRLVRVNKDGNHDYA